MRGFTVLSLILAVAFFTTLYNNNLILIIFTLYTCIHVFFTLFKVIPHTHCLLLGQRAVGKKMVTRLAAEMLDATIYELDHNNKTQSNSILRNVCMTAGLDRQKVILLVDASNESQNDGYWKQVLELMREGTCMMFVQ